MLRKNRQKINIQATLLLTSFIWIGGCAKHADAPPSDHVTRRLFGAAQTDGTLDFSHAKSLKPSLFLLEQKKQVAVYSKDWIELSDQLMEAGDVMPQMYGDRVSLLGHRLSQSFYRDTRAYTVMTGMTNPPGSPYAEIAEYYARPALKKKIVDIVKDAQDVTHLAASRTKIFAPVITSDSNPSIVIDAVIAELKSFENELRSINQSRVANGSDANTIVKQIAQKVDDKYLQDLIAFKGITIPQSHQSVKNYMTILRDRLWKLEEFSESDRKKLSAEVERGRKVAERLEGISNSEGALTLLTDLWTSRALRAEFPPYARSFFIKYTPAKLLALATNNQSQVQGASNWDAIKNRHDYGVLSPRDLLSIYIRENGRQPLSEADWNALLPVRKYALETLVRQKDVRDFAEQITADHIKDPEEALITLIDNWLAMSFRLSMPTVLQNVFTPLPDQKVSSIGDESTVELFWTDGMKMGLTRHQILEDLDVFDAPPGAADPKVGALSRFKDLVNTSIVKATQARINASLRPIAEKISNQIIDALEPALQAQIDGADTAAIQAYRKYGRFYLGQKIFGISSLEIKNGDDTPEREQADAKLLMVKTLPLLEKNKVRFSNVNSKGLMPIDVQEDNQTSAELIGLSLSHFYYRLKGLQTYENIFPESLDAISLQFQVYNKLLAIGGFATETGEIIPGLNVSTTPGHGPEQLNMKNYDASISSFAVPDVVTLRDNYKLDPETKRSANISVEGQMELLRGYAAMMRYSKPWVPSNFDIGLPRLRMKEDPSIEAFPKESFFSLSFGLASVILKNVQAKMLGLILANEEFIEGKSAADTSKVDAVAATLSNYDPEHMSHIVTSEGTAKAIIALSDFLTETEDIDRATNPPFNDPKTMDQIKTGRVSVRKLLSGLAVFSSHYLTDSNGAFASGYDVDRKRVVNGPKVLSDQLIMEEALLKVGHVLGADFFSFRALDNFFFLNKNFWNVSLGFYGAQGAKEDSTLKLVNVARFLKNLQSFKTIMQDFLTQSPSLENSLEQASNLEAFLMARYFPTQDDLNPLLKVLDFSL